VSDPKQAVGAPAVFGPEVDEDLSSPVAAVFPAGWEPQQDALSEDDLWELTYEDPGTDMTPARLDALLAQLPPELLDDPEMDGDGDDPPEVAGLLGLMPRGMIAGGGFDAGGVGDRLPPGVALTALASRTWDAGLQRLNDDELVGLALAWRRLQSWAGAGELAAVAGLARRRERQAAAAGDPGIADHLGDELAMAMTLTGRASAALLDFAAALATLPATKAALAAGGIDRVKAHVITEELSGLSRPLAARVETQVLGNAGRQTTSQLRAAAKRAVLKADPAAARRRHDAARRQARVEVWHEPSGTATLAGRDLPPAEVLAADQRITTLAKRLKASGHDGTLNQLRAQVYTALLLGHPTGDPTTPPAPGPVGATTPPPARPGTQPEDPGGAGPSSDEPTSSSATTRPATDPARGGTGAASGHPEPAGPAGLRGSVNLTLPLATWLGTSDSPGELAGLGPILADDARALAHALATRPGNRWCLTITGRGGQAIAHGCTSTNGSREDPTGRNGPCGDGGGNGGGGSGGGRRRTRQDRAGQTSTGPPGTLTVSTPAGPLTITVSPLAVGICTHQRETLAYHPTAGLRHALHIRQRTCSAPGCRRHATSCDLDHTTPYANGGRTCECGLAPLCRRHHRAKQTHGWTLRQPQPGVLIWQLPHGRTHRVEPDPYFD
jgi:hypothetical protein